MTLSATHGMELTSYQQEMLNGKYGKGKAMALQIQKAVGESFRAARFLPVSRAHVSLSAQEADIWFAEKMYAAGAVCAVPPSVNPGYSLSYFTSRGLLDEAGVENMRKAHDVYQRLGAIPTYSCTPYLFGNIPCYGEILAYSETSATIYVNAVLGARTNRESAASALCAAITGFVPEYGMLLPKTRMATVLVDVQADLRTPFDYACLGLMGKAIGKGIPVFSGLPEHISTEALIALGTQLNVSGTYDMFHIPWITPEAITLVQALGGKEPERHVVITREDIDWELERFSPPVPQPVSFVMLGCPHYTYEQVAQVDSLLKAKTKIPIWILTSCAVEHLAEISGLAQRLRQKGVDIVADTCVDQVHCWKHLSSAPGATDSPKCAYYMHSFGVRTVVRNVETCLKWAVEGGGAQ